MAPIGGSAAEGFFGLVCSDTHERVVLGIDARGDADEMDAYLTFAADIFLRGLWTAAPTAEA